jgi:hypothetical protein
MLAAALCSAGQTTLPVTVDEIQAVNTNPPSWDQAANRTLIASLKRQAVVPNERQRSQWDIDGYELHAHPDLVERLGQLGEGSHRDVTAAYGLPVLVRPIGRPFAVAVGTSTLLLRVGVEPDDVLMSDAPSWFRAKGWVSVDAWQVDLPREEGTARLRKWVGEAFDKA